MKNNKKTTSWNHNLVAMAWFLGWLVVTSLSVSLVGIYNVTLDPVRFVAQQFLGTTTVVGWGAWGGAVGNQFIATAAPVNPWTFFFNFIMQNALQNNVVAPTCDVVGNVLVPVTPGIIGFATTTNPPAGVVSICGILDHATNQVVAAAPFNVLLGQFKNLLPGSYDLVCLTKMQNKPRKTANFCIDGTFDIIDTTQVNPIPPAPNPIPAPNPNPGGNNPTVTPTPAPAPIPAPNPGGNNPTVTPTPAPTPTTPAPVALDLELYANTFPSQGAAGTPGVVAYKFKVFNNPANAGGAANDFTLRVYSQWLSNITAAGAVQVGPVTIWKINSLAAGDSIGFFLQGTPGAWLNVVAELCDYANDGDSKECNMINLTPSEDDEVKA